MKLLKFELKKTWRRKQFTLLLLLVLVSVLGIFFRNVLVQDEIANKALKNLEPHIQEAYQLQTEFKKEMAKRSVSDTFLTGYENALKMNTTVRDWELAILDHDWESIPTIEKIFLQGVFYHIVELDGKFGDFDEAKLEQALEKNAILLEHHLPYEDDQYSISTPNFMKSAGTLVFSLYGVLIFILLIGDKLSIEIENSTINNLYTQPFRKWRILFSKFTSSMIAVLFVLVVFIAACMLVPLAFGGRRGSFSYPQLILFADSYTYISIIQYLVKLVLLFIGTTMFSISLVLFFSLLLKNRFSTLICTLLVLSSGVIVTNQSKVLQIGLNPFYYFRFNELIERPDTSGQFMHISVLFAYSFLIMLLCYFVQNNVRTININKPFTLPFRKGKTLQKNLPLLSLFTFEWRKQWRQQYLKQLVVIIPLLIIGGYFFITHFANQKEHAYLEKLENDILTLEQQLIPKYEKEILEQETILKELDEKDIPLSESEEILKIQGKSFLPTLKKQLDELNLNLEHNQNHLVSYQKNDWLSFYEKWIYTLRNETENSSFIDNRPTERIGLSDYTYMASIQEKKLLSEQQLDPVFNGIYLSTIYDHFVNPLDQVEWKRETGKVDNTGLFYLYKFFDSFVFLLSMGILVLLFGNGFISEKGRKSTLSLLVTQPLSKYSIYTAKTGVSMIITSVVTVLSILLLVLIGTAGNRFGDWTFPVLHYDTPTMVQSVNYRGTVATEGGFHFIHMGSYLVESSVLFLVAILFLIALSLLISVFFKNTISSMLTLLFVTIGGYYVSLSSIISPISQLSPFTYLNVGKVANGEIAVILNNSSIHTLQGISVLLFFTAVLVGVGLIVFRKSRSVI